MRADRVGERVPGMLREAEGQAVCVPACSCDALGRGELVAVGVTEAQADEDALPETEGLPEVVALMPEEADAEALRGGERDGEAERENLADFVEEAVGEAEGVAVPGRGVAVAATGVAVAGRGVAVGAAPVAVAHADAGGEALGSCGLAVAAAELEAPPGSEGVVVAVGSGVAVGGAERVAEGEVVGESEGSGEGEAEAV